MVPSIEAWLIADHKTFAARLGVSEGKLVDQPEALKDPKAEVLLLARQSSRNSVKTDLLPRKNSGLRVGPGYANFLIGFVESEWDPKRAAVRAPSLARALSRTAELLCR